MLKIKNKTMDLLGSKAFKVSAGAALVALASASVVSCGGGGGSGSSLPPGIGLVESAAQVTPSAAIDNYRLSATEVKSILEAGVAAASARGVQGTFAIVDRVGNVLAVYATDGSDGVDGSASCASLTTSDPTFFTNGEILISGGRTSVTSGLDNKKPCLPRGVYAISKAITGAYLSSSGNAFSTRTASLIVQEHFYPGEANTPAGPLFGVQFSQLPCGDLVRDVDQDGSAGPKRSPLGLSADPGGFPLYKNGVVVGGIGFIKAGGTYGLDLNPRDVDNDDEEVIAYSASRAGAGFTAPDSIRGNRISGGGVFLLYSDTDGNAQSASPTLIGTNFKTVTGYYTSPSAAVVANNIKPAIAYGENGSGYRKMAASDLGLGDLDPSDDAAIAEIEARLISRGAYVLTDGSGTNNRYKPTSGTNISSLDVARMLDKAYEIAFRGRAQIRTPVGSAIQVTISVVDTTGNVLGIVRTPDAPVFGTDVSLQKARSAMFMSSALDADQKSLFPADYSPTTGLFSSITKFDGSVAFSARGFGNFARPFYTDGKDNAANNGPFSKTFSQWSPFSTGLQLDVSLAQILGSITATNRTNPSCAPSGVFGATTKTLPTQNGLQIFPGGFPIYSGNTLVGGIGISGDGIDQDDMISFLGLENARLAGASGIGHAPNNTNVKRIDQFTIGGKTARYVNCPFKPFNDSDQTNPCEGI